MANVYPQGNGWMVRWREGGRGSRQQAKYFAIEAEALRFKELKDNEAAGRKLAKRVLSGAPDWSILDQPAPAYESEYAVREYLRSVIDRDRSLRQGSRDTYAHALKNHVEGSPLGKADIRAVQPADVVQFWSALGRLGPGALRNVRQLISKAFTSAVREGIIDANPMTRAGIKAPPKERQTEIVPLTTAEVERLADAAASQRDRIMVLMMAYAGLRAGEVGGLRVQDVDLERCRLNIRQQVVYERGTGPVVAPLKTKTARRTITVPCSVTEELKEYCDASPPARDGRIFPGRYRDGEGLTHVAVNHVVQRAAKRAGMRPVNAHLLRHTAVSWLIEDGANPRAVQAFCGHSDIKITLGIYAHLFDYGGQSLAESMERRRAAHRNSS